MPKMTEGEYRVGINFNPSGDDVVGQIKRAAADLIDLIRDLPLPELSDDDDFANSRLGEVMRLKSLAMNAIEEGAMWGVKAATKPDPK
jgi:hypothetical protein